MKKESKEKGSGFIFIGIILIVIIALGLWFVYGKNLKIVKVPNDSNDYAEKSENGRFLTIINDTKQIINEIHVYIGEGTEIEKMKRENIDTTSLSIEIPEDYSEYKTFTVVIIDRYNMKYQKEINEVKDKGRTEIKINQDNYVKEKGDFLKNIYKFFNGD